MNARLAEIAQRKELLLVQSEQGRDEIARRYYQWQTRTVLARQVTNIFKNPLVLAGLGLFAFKMPWRKSLRFGGWFWRGWKLFRTVRRMF
jgi:hypothetical protein